MFLFTQQAVYKTEPLVQFITRIGKPGFSGIFEFELFHQIIDIELPVVPFIIKCNVIFYIKTFVYRYICSDNIDRFWVRRFLQTVQILKRHLDRFCPAGFEMYMIGTFCTDDFTDSNLHTVSLPLSLIILKLRPKNYYYNKKRIHLDFETLTLYFSVKILYDKVTVSYIM